MNTPNKKDALGKGIRSLLQNIDADLSATANNLQKEPLDKISHVNVRVPLSLIDPNPEQPRKNFDKEALEELAASIRLHDIIQPVTVARLSNGRYRIIAGERRYKAAKMAGLADVPVFIRETKDSKTLELALLENLQREDLNAIEIALSYKQLMDEMNYTQEELSERMGKERSTITNYIRLLKLPPDIQAAVRNNIISMGHARALINVDAIDKQLYIFNEIKNKELSVRQTEELVRKLYIPRDAVNNSVKTLLPPSLKKIEDNLASYFSTRVKMIQNKKGKGSITLEYYSPEELNAILEKMHISTD
ncbi:MAG TPA: ParB/RepB/Spo0J family partition protein [Chitinophagaceae bacterium]|nr:ParB/RepB/Spo0J family partition protein [Chitinophagaceae bacterium]